MEQKKIRNEKGFAPILIVILVIVVIVAGYFILKSKNLLPGINNGMHVDTSKTVTKPLSQAELAQNRPNITNQGNTTAASNAKITPILTEQVYITSGSITPKSVQVPSNTEVIFLNSDTNPHQLIFTSTNKDTTLPTKASSDTLVNPKGAISYIFKNKGIYLYSDTKNSSLKGEIIVK